MLHVKEQIEQKAFAEPLPFTEAIEYLKSRVALTPEEFYKLDAKARFKAFTVSKLTGLDAIERVKEKLAKSTPSKEDFLKELQKDEILKAVGFHKENPFYLETVYRTNIASAYNAGRWAQIQRSKDIIKYLRYIAIDDGRTTPICKSLNGTTLPADDPFWKKYTPPNHFNCRSSIMVITRFQKGYRKNNPPKHIPDTDKGFLANPFDSWWKLSSSMIERAIKYGVVESFINEAKKNLCDGSFADDPCDERLKEAFGFKPPKTEEFKDWINKILKSKFKARGEIKNIGWIERTIRAKVKELMNYDLDNNPMIVVNDKGILHILRDAKKGRGSAVPEDLIYRIPEILDNPEAILLDTQDKRGIPTLLYITTEKDKKAKFVIKLSRTVQVIDEGKRKKIEVNLLTTAGLVKIIDLKQKRYVLLKGKLE